LDIGMPDMDGYECCERLRAQGFAGAIIAVTGYNSSQDRQRALAAGFDRHLVKPVSCEQLEEAWMDLIPQQRLISSR
jgi:CheY-like chemotaxis protein